MLILWLPAESLAQDNEKELVGSVSTSNYRAPFGDDVEIFNLGQQVNSEFSEYNPVVTPDAKLMLYTARTDSTTGEQVRSSTHRIRRSMDTTT